jgi:enoyl-CoA hydratase/carnithine racemase
MTIVAEKSNGVVWATLTRPKNGNALDSAIVEELDNIIDEAVAENQRLLVIRGNDRNFCTGFDLSGIEHLTDADLMLRFIRIELLLQKLAAVPLVTIALVTGRAIGAGADIVVACDRRFATENASFSFPGAGFGLILGTHRLSCRVGLDRAREFVRSGRTLTASQALEANLINAIVAPTQISSVIETEFAVAERLDTSTHLALNEVTPIGDEDSALAALARSAARHGIKDRLLGYRSGLPSKPRSGT